MWVDIEKRRATNRRAAKAYYDRKRALLPPPLPRPKMPREEYNRRRRARYWMNPEGYRAAKRVQRQPRAAHRNRQERFLYWLNKGLSREAAMHKSDEYKRPGPRHEAPRGRPPVQKALTEHLQRFARLPAPQEMPWTFRQLMS